MRKHQEYVFVLWGEHFEELAAIAFITALREVGLRVKLVSLTSQKSSGSYGLALVPDWTLEKALPLANQAISVILPCKTLEVKRLEGDPRLVHFCQQAQANRATFVVGRSPSAALPPTVLFPEQSVVTTYPGNEEVVAFARDLATSLCQTG